jgi:Enoyl-CoA hydratase/isomerase
MTEHIKIRQDGTVLEITFARSEKKNALTNAMYRAATEALNAAQNNQAIRVVLFAAEGDAFTAGNDLADFASAATGKDDGLAAHGFIEALGRADKPIVAAVTGLAVGVGTTMLLHCDLVFISEGAKLSTPFVNLGSCARSSVQPTAASAHRSRPCFRHVRTWGGGFRCRRVIAWACQQGFTQGPSAAIRARSGAHTRNAAARGDCRHQKVDARQATNSGSHG